MQDSKIAADIAKIVQDGIEDYTGKTNLVKLIELIAHADLLVSNETSAVHMAVSTNTRFVCISNANHIGRFNPYPAHIYNQGTYVYPDQVDKMIRDAPRSLCEKYRIFSDLDINTISVEKVMKQVEKVCGKALLS